MRAPLEAIIIILLRSFSLSSSSRASKRPRHKSHRPHADDMMMAVPLHAKKSNEKVRRMKKKKKKNFCFCSASASGLKPRFPSMYVCTYYITYYYLPTQLALSILHVHRFYPFMYCRQQQIIQQSLQERDDRPLFEGQLRSKQNIKCIVLYNDSTHTR